MNVDKPTVYTTETCAYCKQVKDYLTKKNIPFNTVDLTNNPEKAQELYEKTGALTAPITEHKGKFVIGANYPRLSEILTV